jgi:[NiFe] hydrogenase assembly HybE family chaperone
MNASRDAANAVTTDVAVTIGGSLRGDPSSLLVASFRAAAARMKGLTFVNPALEVEAVGFAPWTRHWLGVLVTPWCMNLVLAPRDPAYWTSLPVGAKRRYRFPAGEFEFIGAADDAIGDYQVCSLFSPMQEFADAPTARLVAALAREALFDAAHAEPSTAPARSTNPPDAETAPGPIATFEGALAKSISRRDLLRGRLPGKDHDSRG